MGDRATTLPGVDLVTLRRGPQLSFHGQQLLMAPVTISEIDEAMASIDAAKAPGVDGFNAVFFKAAWPEVKHDIYAAVFEFFKTGHMATQWNCTSITLIPKVPNPQSVKDFRPISCCTVLYKIVSKILTRRLGQVIGEVVNEAQAGFIPGKHIGDNILLATELMKGKGTLTSFFPLGVCSKWI